MQFLASGARPVNTALLNANVPQPHASVALMQTDKQTSMLPSLLVAGAFAAVLLPTSETAYCMGKKRKKDSVLEDDMYEVDYIKARRLVKGQPEYLIKWKGFEDEKYDTWEPLANLSGLEPDLAAFEARQKKNEEAFARQRAARKAAKKAASGGKAAASSAASSAAATGEATGEEAVEAQAVAVKEEGSSLGRRRAAIWARWKATSKPGEYECQEPKPGGCGGIYGAKLHQAGLPGAQGLSLRGGRCRGGLGCEPL